MATYVQTVLASRLPKDFPGSLEYAILLEALGKQTNDKNIECLGVLHQVYANWKMGKIQLAYSLVNQAAGFSKNDLSTHVRVKSLSTTAQMAAEEKYAEEALQTAEEAVQIARTSNDSKMLFDAMNTQALVALSVGKYTAATNAMNQLLEQSARSPYLERKARAKNVELAVTSYAGMTLRANQAVVERLRLLRRLRLDEAIASTLVDFADLQLKSKHYAEAAAASDEALQQGAIPFDMRLSNSAHFSHAIANIYLGKIGEGKAEFERLFKSGQERAQLLSFLPEYAAVLTQAGDANASVQAAAIRKRLEFEEALIHAKEAEKASGQLDLLARENQLKALAASNPHNQSNGWFIAAISTVVGLIALLYLRGRARRGVGIVNSPFQTAAIP